MKHFFMSLKRSDILKMISIFAFFAIIVRLFILQVVSHEKYVAKAREEQVKKLTIPAKRGKIYALDGDNPIPIVLNDTVYTLFVDPKVLNDKAKNQIREALEDLPKDNVLPDLEHRLNNSDSRYQVLARSVSLKDATKLKTKKISNLGFQAQSKRVYPEGKLASQVLGFVNYEGGQYGVEGGLDKELSGKDGILEAVTDVAEVPLTIGSDFVNVPAQDGKNLVLTIDRNIQKEAEKITAKWTKEFEADSVSLLVMNPNNGQVQAMANTPDFDPNEFNKVKDVAAFNNNITMLAYEPASVMKIFTDATGIDRGVITPETKYYNHGYVKVYDRIINNSTNFLLGNITIQDGFNQSYNTSTVFVLAELGGGSVNMNGVRILYDYFHNKFNFGKYTGIEVPESAGVVVSPDKNDGTEVRYANMTFGQGLNVPMIQVASALSTIVNGGNLYKPTVIAGEIDADNNFIKKDNPLVQSGIIKKGTTESMIRMMNTLHKRFWGKEKAYQGFTIGGKTGTAETIVDGKYTKSQTVASYVGFGGGDKPEYVIMVRVAGKNKQYDGMDHGNKVFEDMSKWLINYLKIQPKKG